MQIAQIPAPPSQPTTGINKGVTLYTNQDATNAHGLFGSKPLAIDNIYLRGVVVTSKNKAGALDGFAIFEIDGKPTNAISVGESLGKGLASRAWVMNLPSCSTKDKRWNSSSASLAKKKPVPAARNSWHHRQIKIEQTDRTNIKMATPKTSSHLFLLSALLISSVTFANETSNSDDFFQIIKPQSQSQLWINPGMISYHFQKDQNLNNGNWGAGLEYRFNAVTSLTAGHFYNSDRDYSNYAGMHYQHRHRPH